MARILLLIEDDASRLTLKAMLEAEGHRIVKEGADMAFADDPARARAYALRMPVLLLATAAGIPAAVEALREGVYGYIFVPLQPGEAALMVRRALNAHEKTTPSEEEPLTLAEAERRHIEAALRRCRFNQARTARELGIGRNTLWRKLRAMRQKADPGKDG